MAEWSRILPLVFFFLFLAVLAAIGFVVYSIVMDVKSQTENRMKEKHVTFSRDGMKVSMQELKDEDYRDNTQSVLVDIWNYGTALPNTAKRRWWRRNSPNGSSS